MAAEETGKGQCLGKGKTASPSSEGGLDPCFVALLILLLSLFV